MGAQLEVLAAQLTAPAGDRLRGRDASSCTGAPRPARRSRSSATPAAGSPRARVTASADGTFKASVEAATGYRARTAAGESPAVTATLLDVPKVKLTAANGRLKVSTTPAAKGLTARFEERRGSGVAHGSPAVKLDAAGRASVKERSGKLRVVLDAAARPRSRRAGRSGV